PTEKRKNLAAERAVNSKAYITGGEAKLGIDPSRIETRTGSAATMTAEYWIVPAGGTFSEAGTQAVDESVVKAVPDHPHAAPKKKAKSAAQQKAELRLTQQSGRSSAMLDRLFLPLRVMKVTSGVGCWF